MTLAGWVEWVRQGCLVLSAGLIAALGAGAMLASIESVAADRTAAPQATEPERPALLDLADELMGSAVAAPVAREEEPDSRAGEPLRITLSVLAGPERSEVFVNGTRLGYSPYLGDYTCKRGEGLRIEVVPTRLPLIERRARCDGKNVLIRD
jgi:hypothetical protein